jgi:hypothetical protein
MRYGIGTPNNDRSVGLMGDSSDTFRVARCRRSHRKKLLAEYGSIDIYAN